MSKKSYKILLIDDSQTDYILTDHYLSAHEDYSFEVEWSNTYEKGLENIVADEYDACLLDYHLGDKTGLELAKDAVSKGCTNPIVIFSGLEEQKIAEVSKDAGAAAYISKHQLSSQNIIDTLTKIILYREQKIKEQSVLLESIAFEHLPTPVMGIDSEGRIIIANQAFEKYTDLSQRDALGMDAHSFLGASHNVFETLSDNAKTITFKVQLNMKGSQDHHMIWKVKKIDSPTMTGKISYLATGSLERRVKKKKQTLFQGLFKSLDKMIFNPSYVKINDNYINRDLFS